MRPVWLNNSYSNLNSIQANNQGPGAENCWCEVEVDKRLDCCWSTFNGSQTVDFSWELLMSNTADVRAATSILEGNVTPQRSMSIDKWLLSWLFISNVDILSLNSEEIIQQ